RYVGDAGRQGVVDLDGAGCAGAGVGDGQRVGEGPAFRDWGRRIHRGDAEVGTGKRQWSLGLEGPDVAVSRAIAVAILRSMQGALIRGRAGARVAGIHDRTGRQQIVSLGWAAVVTKWPKQWIGFEEIAGLEEGTGYAAVQVVAEGLDGSRAVVVGVVCDNR